MKQGLSKWKRFSLFAGSIGAFAVSAGLFSGHKPRDNVTGYILIATTTLCAVLIQAVVRHQYMDGDAVEWKRLLPLAAILAAGVVFILLWSLRQAAADGLGFWGAVLVFIASGLAIAELRRSKWASKRFGSVFAALAAVLLVAAVLRAGAGNGALLLPMVGAAVLLLLVALNLLSAVGNRRLKTWPLGRTLALAGVSLAFFGATVVLAGRETGISAGYMRYFAAGLLVFMTATASRSNVDVSVVLLGIMLLLVATPTPVGGPRRPTGGEVSVVLGDSFMSGEGAEHYFENTNVKEQNQCRRAPTAYALSLVKPDSSPYEVAFLACSGAHAVEVYAPEKRTKESNGKGRNQIALAKDELVRDKALVEKAPFVLLSIGGNDSFFGNIVKACVAPGDCSKLAPAWRANLTNLAPTLRDAYRAVMSSFPGVPVLVVPYPVPIVREQAGCARTTFTAAEHHTLYDFTRELDAVIAGVVAEAEFTRLHYVDTMPPALLDAGLALCGSVKKSGVNFLAANGVGGLTESSVNPSNWIHNSLHPNDTGHEAMRRAAQAWLDSHPDVRTGMAGVTRRTAPKPPDETFGPIDPNGRCVSVVTGPPPTEGVTKALENCTSAWTLSQVSAFARFPGALLLLPLLAAWLSGLAIVRLARIAGNSLWQSKPLKARRESNSLAG